MLTLHDLLEDKTYKKFFQTVPKMPDVSNRLSPPWRVYIQRDTDGPWARKEFWSYAEAYRWLKPRLSDLHDATIQSKGIAFKPPNKIVKVSRGGKPVLIVTPNGPVQKTQLIVWKPRLEPEDGIHTWCCYCRRPTIFRWFTKHHNFRKDVFDPTLKRCPICGASELLVRGW